MNTESCFVKNDGGYTSMGVAIALFLVIALLFSAAQVYWAQSASSDIQFAADAGALAAENVVAEYYIVARVVDSVIFTMSVFAITIYASSVVAFLIPSAQGIGASLLKFANKVVDARDKFSKTASKTLDGIQKALPALCAFNAGLTISENKNSAGDSLYMGFAIPYPLEGDAVHMETDDGLKKTGEQIEKNDEEMAEDVKGADKAKKEMDSSKLKAYNADCGNNPNYCMYQRASTLSGMSTFNNPYYGDVEQWSFDVALKRAQHYYRARLATETPESASIDDIVNSEARKIFYKYAIEEVDKGYVHESNSTFDAKFPLLFKNTDEMKDTHLYSDALFYVSNDGKIHGSSSCAAYQKSAGAKMGSLAQLDSGQYSKCATCKLAASTLGKVGSASSNIENGFEYHYRIVAKEAENYKKAKKEFDNLTKEAKGEAKDSIDKISKQISAIGGKRYDPKPPGRQGCIAFAFDASKHDVVSAFQNGTLDESALMDSRLAISGAALVEDNPDEGRNLITSLLDGVTANMKEDGAFSYATLAPDYLLGGWGGALQIYSDGTNGLIDGLDSLLGSVPDKDGDGLGGWAHDAINDALKSTGMQPPKLSTPKPVTLNTKYVLEEANQDLAGLLDKARTSIGYIKEAQATFSDPTGLFGSFLDTSAPDISQEKLKEILGKITTATKGAHK